MVWKAVGMLTVLRVTFPIPWLIPKSKDLPNWLREMVLSGRNILEKGNIWRVSSLLPCKCFVAGLFYLLQNLQCAGLWLLGIHISLFEKTRGSQGKWVQFLPSVNSMAKDMGFHFCCYANYFSAASENIKKLKRGSKKICIQNPKPALYSVPGWSVFALEDLVWHFNLCK